MRAIAAKLLAADVGGCVRIKPIRLVPGRGKFSRPLFGARRGSKQAGIPRGRVEDDIGEAFTRVARLCVTFDDAAVARAGMDMA